MHSIPLQLLFIKQSLKDGWKEWVPWERKERKKGNGGLAKYQGHPSVAENTKPKDVGPDLRS